jgi:hypothetical protein
VGKRKMRYASRERGWSRRKDVSMAICQPKPANDVREVKRAHGIMADLLT